MKYKIFIFSFLVGLGLASFGATDVFAATKPALSVFTSANKINTIQMVSLTALASSHLGEAVSSIAIDFGGNKQTCENKYYCDITVGPFEKKGNVKYTVEAKMKINGKETRTVKKGVIAVVPTSAVLKEKSEAPIALSVFTSTNKIDTQQTVDVTALAISQIGSQGTIPSITIDVGGVKQTCEDLNFCKLTAGPFEKKGNVKYVVEAKMRLSVVKNGKISSKEIRSVKKGVITVVAAKKAAAAKTPVAETSNISNAGGPQSGTGTNVASGANYKGPFPAPEGMVLTGITGEDKFQNPTGNGTYRFKIQTAWKKNIACLDETRTVVGSKGKTWEEGYWKGGDLGKTAKSAIIVVYDETPKGDKAGTALYDEGYKAGYAAGFADIAPPYVYGCHDDEGFDISKYDKDGWVKQSVDKLPGLSALYMPAEGEVLSNLDSVLGSSGVVFSFDDINSPINKTALNVGKPKLNISRIDLIEGQLDSAEAALSAAEFAKAFYNQQKKVIENKYKGSCTVAEAAVTDEVYGNNSFANLAFITVCLDSSGGENKWALSKYGFMKMPGDKMLMVSIGGVDNVKTNGADSTDSAKIPSKDFIAQLYSKIQVK
ncbi:MAG: hypothetical protein HZC05_00570 [Candidatus Magasanikbacteria bacterium]|nr:hypothetical protein [Candidatus Magasanikbacteria bacterium]